MKKLIGGLLTAVFVLGSCSVGVTSVNSSEGSDVATKGTDVEETAYGRLTGVNWFGFETNNYCPHGLWTRDYESMLQQIYDLGFNCVRFPWCNEMLDQDPSGISINEYGVDAYTGETGLNTDLDGLSSIEVMDVILDKCAELGLYIILDNHSREADAYLNEALWYTDSFTEEEWIEDWEFIVDRYKDNEYFVGADLNNEPHDEATWGDGTDYDWKAASEKCGEAILAIDPDLLILVEGVEEYNDDTYWWGGNLAGAADYPIDSSSIPDGNLVYSPHEYGPEVYAQTWFTDDDFPNNMPDIWDEHFWFIYEDDMAPLLFGEFGIKESSAEDTTCTAYIWFTTFMEYVGDKSSWTFWCMNPNSGDTGGILQDDWVSVNTAKYGLIEPYLASQSGSDDNEDPDEEDDTAPDAPANLSATVTDDSVSLSWDEVSADDLDEYRVYRGTSSADLSLIGTSEENSYDDEGLTAETTYYYGVSAVDSSDNESDMTTLTVTTDEKEVVEASDAELSLSLSSSDSSDTTNTIGYSITITNDDDSDMDLSRVSFRYYFSNDSDASLTFWCDYAGGILSDTWESLTDSVEGTYYTTSYDDETASDYLEITFDEEAGTLSSGGYVGVQVRITNDSWSDFDQSDDFSFGTDGLLFVDDALVSGTLPE
ncbi:MAG: cellulase family glycosylhydrolase [Spirochaetales bacterium]|nr:cellulase family glycosylhydrolase [Spirochaetales bacterium]